MTLLILAIYLFLIGGSFTDFPFLAFVVASAISVSIVAFIWTRHQSYLLHATGLLVFAGIKLILSSGMFSNFEIYADFAGGFLSVVTSSLWVYSVCVLIIATFGALTLRRPETT